MDPKLYYVAAKACRDVYQKNIDLGTTEYATTLSIFKGDLVETLAIAGSNELEDWLINCNLFSKKGIKIGAYKAAHEINKKFKWSGRATKRIVCGHSKAGATAIAFMKQFGADHCVAFAPARSLRYWTKRKMENTTLFIDPDDPVSKLGFFSFGHPKCKIYKAENDHFGFRLDDHPIENWIKFTSEM